MMNTSRMPRAWLFHCLVLITVFLLGFSYFFWRLEPAPRFTLGERAKVRLLDVSFDGSLLAVATDQEIQLWDLITAEQIATFALPGRRIEHTLITPDGKRLISNSFLLKSNGKSLDQSAHIFSITTRQLEDTLALSHSLDQSYFYNKPRSFAISSDSKSMVYLAPCSDASKPVSNDLCTIKLRDLENRREVAILAEKSFHYDSPIAISSDSRQVAAGISLSGFKDIQVKVWELPSGKLKQSYVVPPTTGNFPEMAKIYQGVHALTFSTDCKSLFGMTTHNILGYHAQLLIWNLANGQLEKSLASEELKTGGNTPELHCTSTGQKLLVTASHTLMSTGFLCDLSPAVPRKKPSWKAVPILSNSGKHLAVNDPYAAMMNSGIKPHVELIDIADSTSRTICELSLLNGIQQPSAFSSDDEQLVVLVYYGHQHLFHWYDPVLKYFMEPERKLHVYDISSGILQGRLRGTLARFSSDGKTLIAYEEQSRLDDNQMGGIIRVYDFPLRHPWFAILSWTLLVTILVALLLRWNHKRYARRLQS